MADADRRWFEIPIELPEEGANARFVIEETPLLLCYAEGQPFIVRDECPHVRTSMQGGLIKGTVLECPLHGGKMDVRDGSPVAMPIRRPGVCFPVREEAGKLQVGLPA
ncbi:MAG: Rieske 2Fe-2S domain-containing protein [Myxococcota bacterium]